MKQSNIFQYVFIGAFVLFAVIGIILFATYRNKSKELEQVPIVMWGTVEEDRMTKFLDEVKTLTGRAYNINYVEKEAATLDSELVEALASNSGPNVLLLPQDLIVRYRERVITIPYSDTLYTERSFDDTFIDIANLYRVTGGYLALPVSVDPIVMYYNRDILNSAGELTPPTNWNQVQALTEKIVRRDAAGNVTRSAVAFGEYRNVTNAKAVMSMLIMQAGSPIVNPLTYTSVLDQKFDYPLTPAVEAMKYYANFANPAQKGYSWNRSLPASIEAFVAGDLAFYFGYASEYSAIRTKNPNLNFAVTIVPQVQNYRYRATYGQMTGLAIMKDAVNPGLILQVLATLTSRDVVAIWTKTFGGYPLRNDLLVGTPDNATESVFVESASIARGWLDPEPNATGPIFQSLIEAITTSRTTALDAVDGASAELNLILQKYHD